MAQDNQLLTYDTFMQCLRNIPETNIEERKKQLFNCDVRLQGPQLKSVYDMFPTGKDKVDITEDMRCKVSPFAAVDMVDVLQSIPNLEERLAVLERLSLPCFDKVYSKDKLLAAFAEGKEQEQALEAIHKWPPIQICPCEPRPRLPTPPTIEFNK